MKILFEMIDFQVGGVQKVNSLIANHYVSLGHEVHFIAPKIGAPSIYDLDEKIQFFWYSSDNIHTKMVELKQHLKKDSYDIYFSGLQSKLRFTAFMAGVPRIIHILHNTYQYNFKEKLVEPLLQFRTEFIAVSDAVADHTSKVLRVPRKKIQTIYNAVDTELFRPAVNYENTGDVLSICSVGRLVPQKGYDILLDVLAECKSRSLPVHCTLIGDGDERSTLEEKAKQLGLEESYLSFAGENREVFKVLNKYDCFVSTLRYGGFEIVLAEAMASGLPVISFEVGPVKEVIGGGNEGVLVEQYNISEFANKIEYFVSHRDELRTRGKRCRERAEAKFSVDTMKRAYQNLLEA